jgi:DNA-binding response OmpR family regulator
MLPMPTQPTSPIPERPILVVDDDAKIVRLVRTYLERDGFSVVTAADGPAALDAIERHRPALVVLDLMLPELDGRAVIRAVRRDDAAAATPILVLSARGSTIDRIAGFEDGADDYLPKPFSFDELLARLRALHRRTTDAAAADLHAGDLVLDPGRRRVFRGTAEIVLSAREFDVLALLLSRAGRCVTRYEILSEVWDGETDLRSNVIDVYIASLRAKVDKPFGRHAIETLRGAGYRLQADGG